MATARIGQIITDKYRIDRAIGRGGQADVYEATNLVLHRKVALKLVREDTATSGQRFMQEAIAASQIRHPAVVSIYDAGTHEDSPWIAMEYLSGTPLSQYLESHGPLTPSQTAHIAREVLSGLAVAHELGIVHRDLKPPNLFLEHREDGTVQPKILDFGIAKLTDDANIPTLANPLTYTQTGVVMGTFAYLSPEQARGDADITAASDIWAMGVVLFEMISGKHPYACNVVTELIAKLLTEKPRDLLDVAIDAPPDLAYIVDQCLQKKASARPTAQNACQMLDDFLSGRSSNADLRISNLPDQTREATGASHSETGSAPVDSRAAIQGCEPHSGSITGVERTEPETVPARVKRRRSTSHRLIAGAAVVALVVGGALAGAVLPGSEEAVDDTAIESPPSASVAKAADPSTAPRELATSAMSSRPPQAEEEETEAAEPSFSTQENTTAEDLALTSPIPSRTIRRRTIRGSSATDSTAPLSPTTMRGREDVVW